MHSLAGNYRDAREFALQANLAKPREPAVVAELIARLRTFNEVEALHACLERLKPLSQMPIPLLMAFGSQLSNLNEQEKALQVFDEAKRADPDYPSMLIARAQVLIYLGKFEEAENDLLRCLKRAPEIAKIYWLLSRLKKQTSAANHIRLIQAELQRAGRRPNDIAMLAYALHKELDDLQEYASAWNALGRACMVKRASLQYQPEDTEGLFSKLIGFPWSTTRQATHSPDQEKKMPIFIVGMHRSGTTLLEQLLDGHSDVQGIGELYDFTAQMRQATNHHCRGVIDDTIVERASKVDFSEVGNAYLNGLNWRLGKERVFSDKLPSNFQNIGFICQALPSAKILHLVRDPLETCFSNLRELFSDACPYSYDQMELAHYFNQYQRLMEHWHTVFPGRIMDVSYAALTQNPEIVMQQVVEFCGLDYQMEMLHLQNRSRGVATASAVQVRGEIQTRHEPKWKPYKAYLEPLLQSLHTTSE